jgi:hypothetical protein
MPQDPGRSGYSRPLADPDLDEADAGYSIAMFDSEQEMRALHQKRRRETKHREVKVELTPSVSLRRGRIECSRAACRRASARSVRAHPQAEFTVSSTLRGVDNMEMGVAPATADRGGRRATERRHGSIIDDEAALIWPDVQDRKCMPALRRG